MTKKKSISPGGMFRTAYNFSFDLYENFEHPFGVSVTIPNEVLTPAEMIQRFTRGLPLPVSASQPTYSDIELPDFQKMDLDEIHEYNLQLQEDISQMEKEIEDAEREKSRLDQYNLMKELVRKELTDENSLNTASQTLSQE